METMWNVECLAEFHCAAALFYGLLTHRIYGRLALLISSAAPDEESNFSYKQSKAKAETIRAHTNIFCTYAEIPTR